MEPKCIVLDEPTAMLDPNGRKEVIEAVEQLRKEKNVTVILITHYMEEVIDADQVFVMDEGHVVMHGTPKDRWYFIRAAFLSCVGWRNGGPCRRFRSVAASRRFELC